MKYSVYAINADESASLLSQFDDLASAQAFMAAQGAGNFRIELGDAGQSSIIEVVSQ